MPGTVPSEEELKAALQALRAQHPTLGTAKLHAHLLTENPAWTVSEKRTKKILQSEGLSLKPVVTKTSSDNTLHPVSKVIEGLDISKWTAKVQVKYFDSYKGKGLVATEKITEGTVVWKEDPFILAPEWYARVCFMDLSVLIYAAISAGRYTTSKQHRLHACTALRLWATRLLQYPVQVLPKRRRALQGSAVGCVCPVPGGRILFCAQRRTRAACPSSRSLDATNGWPSTRSRSAQQEFSCPSSRMT